MNILLFGIPRFRLTDSTSYKWQDTKSQAIFQALNLTHRGREYALNEHQVNRNRRKSFIQNLDIWHQFSRDALRCLVGVCEDNM